MFLKHSAHATIDISKFTMWNIITFRVIRMFNHELMIQHLPKSYLGHVNGMDCRTYYLVVF